MVTDKYGKTDADTVLITILADPTGERFIFSSLNDVNVQVFPNPVENGMFTLKLKGFEPGDQIHIDLVDGTGRLIYSSTLAMQSEATRILPFNIHSHGIYILRIRNKECVINKKIIY